MDRIFEHQNKGGENKRRGKIQKNMYICININSRVTDLHHTLRSIKDIKKLLRVKKRKKRKSKLCVEIRWKDTNSVRLSVIKV